MEGSMTVAQKNKQTHTTKTMDEQNSCKDCGLMPSHQDCQYYLEKEEDFSKQACKLKNLSIVSGDDAIMEQKKPSNGKYRYTLEEMKSYNPSD